MAKTNKLSKIFVILLFVVVAVALTFAFVNMPNGAARAEEISITIYNKGNGEIYSTESQRTSEWRYRSGNGSVAYGGETITAEDAKNTPEKTITANITEEGLQVKAEAQQDSLFFCWATDAEAKNVVSMKSEDTFTYEEVQSFQSKGLYAFFVPILGEELRAAVQFKITYNDTLGDLYLFLGKENVENETLQKHGLPIPSGQLIDIPFIQREEWSTMQEPATLSSTSREVSNLTFAAIPKTEIDSTIDLSRKTSAVFKEWSATYGVYAMNGNQLLSQENRPLPEICDTANSSSSIDPDGSKQYFPDLHTPVDETWSCPSISFRSDRRPPVDGISFDPEILYGNSTTNWLINPFNNKEEYNATITVLPQTISAEFQEVAIVPEIEVTPYVNDEMKDPLTFDRESTEHITFYYGQKNSINAIFVNSDQLVKQPEYQVTQTLLDGTTGKYTSKIIPITQVMGTVSGFNISEIDNSCTITIIPNYGEEYYIDTFTITVDLVTENGFEDIVSKESESVTVVSGDDWYFNPQFTANGVYTFTSGISYQVDLSKKSDSQLHFQVKGSGVFTFEFYLDGAGMESLMPPAYAVYGTGSQINKNGITSGSFGDNTTALAKGNTVVGSLLDVHYSPCTILAVDKVTRIDEVTDWCRASIAVTAGNDDAVTDIYVAHIAFPYNSGYGSIFGPHTAMSVRNVAYYQGHSNVSWDIYDNAKGDKSDWGTISAQSGGKEASQADLTSGTMIDFSINYDDVSYKFYGWSDGVELLSTEKEFSYIVKGKTDGSSETKIYAVLAPTDQPYSYRTGGEFYDENNLENALTMAAERSANVYVLRSVEITKSVTIAPNVNLVIPFDGTNRLHGSADEKDDVQEKISWLVDGDTYKYFTVTIAEEAILTVNGGLYLGGVVNYPSQTYQGHTSGAYSEIVNNGKIVIDDGGIMDVYGHVTGNGSIEVNKNAKLYEPFLILDYAGGTNTLGIFSAGQTPFKRYAMINIECPMTINYGGMLYGHATLYALSAFFSLDQPFVSYDMGSDMGGDGFGHDTIIMLTEGASVTITYNSKKVVHSEVATNCTEGIGQTKLVFDGGAIFSYMLFSAMGLEIPTNSVYFSIPYNFEVEMNGKDAVYETKTDFMIMPGATVKVGTGATLTLNANAWIFDGMVQGVLDGKSYPKANELENAGYSKNGNLIVDGTLRIGQKTTVEGFDFGSLFGGSGSSSFVPQEIPATFLGVVQTNGTGKIEIPEKTILQATIIDGIENRTYFSYTTTARVWDKAHSCFGNLEAGKTYTATGNAEFKLDSIKYANTKGGEDTLTLTLDQEMHGSWMEDHEGHNFDWTPNEKDGYSDLSEGNLHKLLTRQCSELGCNHTEEKELLYAINAFGDVTYKGAVYSEEDLLALLKALFEKEPSEKLLESFKATFKANNGAILKDAQDGYEVVVTLENAYWLVGDQYKETNTLTLNIKPKDVTVTLTAQGCVYGETAKLNDTAFTINGKCGDDVIGLKLKFKDGATPHDAGAYTFVIEQGSNTNKNYNITNIAEAEGTFTVQKMEIEVTLPSYNREYNGNVPEVGDLAAATANKALGYEDKLEDLITLELNGADKNVGKYDVTAKINGQTADNEDKNYKYTFKNGTYEITKKKVTVTAEDKQSEFGKQIVPLTFKVNTLVEGENINDFIKISTDATQDSPVGSNYTITVEWKDSSRPQNYEVTQFNNGHYTIVAAGFGAITFDEVNVTYDGKPHTPKMNGAPEGASVTYKLKKDGQYTEPFTSATNAATYELQATVSLANYESQDITLTLTINKRAITVDLPSKTRAYDGTVPQASELEPTLHTDSTLGEGDKLEDIVELSIENAAKDVKDYAVKGTQKTSATNYTVTFGNDGTYKITQANVTVKILPQTKVYDGKVAELAQDKWEKTSGDWAQGVAPKIVLKFASSADVKNFGTYDIEGECTDSNYKVEFTDGKGAYSIAKRSITVAAENKQSTYGDAQVELSYSVTGNEDISDDASIQVKLACSVNAQSPYNEDGYPITVTVLNKDSLTNYDVHEVNGTYTVNKKDVTVTINDQNDVYNFQKAYKWDASAWTVDEKELANNENKSVLGVSLTRPALDGAGTYAILATYSSNNYNVTFEGAWAKEDSNKGKAGTYTVAKKHVEEDGETVMFTLLVDGEEYQGTEVFPYVGENFELTATVFVLEGEDDYKELAYTIDPAELTEVKIYTVTVTINDDNYEGSREFTVEVVTDDGFSQNLKNVLAELERIVGDVTKETLKATEEHFEMIKQVKEQLAKLTDTDKELGAEKLAKYEELVETWKAAADISDDVIETAKNIADSPIKWLFAMAEMSVLLAALYVVGKGGLM